MIPETVNGHKEFLRSAVQSRSLSLDMNVQKMPLTASLSLIDERSRAQIGAFSLGVSAILNP